MNEIELFWTKVESWFLLGGNVFEAFQRDLPGKYPQVICTDGVVESFLFNYFKYFQFRNGFEWKAFDFNNESAFVHLTEEDVKSIFRIQFGGMKIEEFESVNEFIAVNQNVIRFAEYIQADDLLNKIAELIVTFNISDFDCFWNDFKSLFAEYDEDGNIVVVNPQFVKLSATLLLAAIRKDDQDLIDLIAVNLAEDDAGFYVEAFLDSCNEFLPESCRSALRSEEKK